MIQKFQLIVKLTLPNNDIIRDMGMLNDGRLAVVGINSLYILNTQNFAIEINYKFTKEYSSRKMVELEENTIFISNFEGIDILNYSKNEIKLMNNITYKGINTIAKLSNERVAISLYDRESNKKIIRIIKSKNPYELIKDIELENNYFCFSMLQLDETDILATNEGQFYDLRDYKLIKNIPVFDNYRPGESQNSLYYLKEKGILLGAGFCGIFIVKIPDLTLIKEYDGLNNNTIYCPNQFCELQNGKILCISGENAGGTGSFFVFSPDDINNGEFKSFTEDEIMRTLVKINETKFAVGLENGDVKFYQF